jgi:hypothetical protein
MNMSNATARSSTVLRLLNNELMDRAGVGPGGLGELQAALELFDDSKFRSLLSEGRAHDAWAYTSAFLKKDLFDPEIDVWADAELCKFHDQMCARAMVDARLDGAPEAAVGTFNGVLRRSLFLTSLLVTIGLDRSLDDPGAQHDEHYDKYRIADVGQLVALLAAVDAPSLQRARANGGQIELGGERLDTFVYCAEKARAEAAQIKEEYAQVRRFCARGVTRAHAP